MSSDFIMIDSIEVDCTPKWVYESFILMQPGVNVKGLYKKDLMYYIVCDGIDENTLAFDGTSIWEWFDNNRALGCPISLVDSCPEGAVRIDEREINEIVDSGGGAKNIRNLFSNIIIALPKDFPQINICKGEARIIDVKVERVLTKAELLILKDVILKQGVPVRYKIYVDNSFLNEKEPFRYAFGNGDIDIIPSKLIPYRISKNLLEAIEKDEELWRDKRIKIFSGEINNLGGLMPDEWDKLESRCFINASVFPQINIRNYLSLYEKTIIAFPILGREEEILSSLRITEDELIGLAELGKVGFVLPQSIDRYQTKLIEKIADSSPESLIFSRRLAAMTIISSRNRFPFLYPPIGIKERAEIIKCLYDLVREVDDDKGKIFIPIISELSRLWSISENMINYRGAMGTTSLGLGMLLSKIVKEMTGLERDLEFLSAASTVEWAAPFGSNVSPIFSEGYSDEHYVQILANAYSGINCYDYFRFNPINNYVLDGILSVDSDAPVIDFAKAFESGDISRLRKFLFRISNDCNSMEDAESIVRSFNKDVRNYERKSEQLGEWKISGFLQAALGLAGTMISSRKPELGMTMAGIPLGFWLIDVLSSNRSKNEVLGTAIDTLEGILTGSKPDVVLVARMKK